jgi:UDP-N-acetylglucosamine 2-epimerase (non-hydrolysing)
MKKRTICFIAGTRPEIIKIAPVVNYFSNHPQDYETVLITTGQHREMAQQALTMFDLHAHADLGIMSPSQTLNMISSAIFDKLPKVFEDLHPDLVFVQGDTTTAAMAGVAAFYMQIPVAHIEAGLRTHNLSAPFPEELNRKIISNFSRYNFAPTESAKVTLLRENVCESTIYVTGNTVVDALEHIKSTRNLSKVFQENFNIEKPFVLVTAHRRENFGQGFENICKALSHIAESYPHIALVYPVHLNPNVRQAVHKFLKGHENIILTEPVSYIGLLSLLEHCLFCITDSGGIQEEAPSFGKYTIVLRDFTERMESVHAGYSILTGTDTDKIISAANIQIQTTGSENISKSNPFGDGRASEKIFDIIHQASL